MSESIQILFKRVFENLNIFNHVQSWRRTRRKLSKKSSSEFIWSTPSSFATMEATGQLKQVFKFFDANGDGKISPMELTEVLQSIGGQEKSTASKEAEGIVKQMDCNGDGFIDLDEFMIVMDGNEKGKSGNEEEDEEEEEDDDLKNAFLIFDNDKNGLICAKELQRVLASLGCRNCSLKECRKMIKGVDKDGDGFVDFQEFKSMMSAGN